MLPRSPMSVSSFANNPPWTPPRISAGGLPIAPDGNLFVTLGDRYSMRDSAQDLGTHIGKVVRITPDGQPAPGNPYLSQSGALPEIWSYGHRNPQGATIDPSTGLLWTVEHGARGGDEINRPEGGKNYGWPVITFGRDYSGAKIGVGTAKGRHGAAPALLGSFHRPVRA